MRPVTMFTGQWADLPIDTLLAKVKAFGYDGVELACWGDHFDVRACLADDGWAKRHWALLRKHGLFCWAISNHLTGQATCDVIDVRHKSILPAHVWGDGDPAGVRRRAIEEMKDTARAARKFFDAAPPEVKERHAKMGYVAVNGFTGSPIWHLLYAFPPCVPGQIDAGFREVGETWKDILTVFDRENIEWALEIHPTEIAFDIASTRRTLEAVGHHPRFGFNFDPSHFGYQGVDYLGIIREFGARIRHVHVKDSWWSDVPTEAGVFGGHTEFGARGRQWDFRSPGRGRLDFEAILRALNHAHYKGPLSVEWEDPMMDREAGAAEACAFVRRLDFPTSGRAFDAAFAEGKR